MPVAVAMVLILGLVVFAIALIGLAWAIVVLLPVLRLRRHSRLFGMAKQTEEKLNWRPR
jgi:hypothetical protein